VDYIVAPESFETERFTLRSYRPGDGALLSEAVNASYEHLKTFMPWARVQQQVEESERLCREFRGKYLLAQDFVLGVFAPSGERLLGGCGYHLREGPLALGNAEMGMWIRAEEAGRGLGTEVLRALLRWGFGEWPWKRLSWRCDVRNGASIRVAEKAGMVREGVLRSHMLSPSGERRDTVCFGLLRDETGQR
jgi:RimJ/RimL family protein N-acetyltransferase